MIDNQTENLEEKDENPIMADTETPETQIESGQEVEEEGKQDASSDSSVVSDTELEKRIQQIRKENEHLVQQKQKQKKMKELEELQRENKQLKAEIAEAEARQKRRNEVPGGQQQPQQKRRKGLEIPKVKATSETETAEDEFIAKDRKRYTKRRSDIPGMNIQTLRKLQGLERQANEQLKDYGLTTDSEASMTDGSRTSERGRHSISGGKRDSNSRKSGLKAKASDRVVYPQLCPQEKLSMEYVKEPLDFDNLDLRLLAAGELEIIECCTSQTEKKGRLKLLKNILYYAGHYQWKAVLDLYANVIRQIEVGEKTWDSDFSRLEQLILMPYRLGTKTTRSDSGYTYKKRDNRYAGDQNSASRYKMGDQDRESAPLAWFCSGYQKGECRQTEPHLGVYKGRNIVVQHICAACYKKNRTKAEHPETSPQCPLFEKE